MAGNSFSDPSVTKIVNGIINLYESKFVVSIFESLNIRN